MTFVDMSPVHFYRPALNNAKSDPPKPLQSFEWPVSACKHDRIEMIDLTNSPTGARELEMSNKDFE